MAEAEGAVPIGSITPRHRVRVAGRVRTMRVQPWSGVATLEATVVDGNLISARTPADLGPWMKALLLALDSAG